MQTNFTADQLADPDVAVAERILRTCIHCGMCNATCPTFLLTGDELDGPRGRIYLVKDMLEGDKAASPRLVTHIDRCLSCLSCMTTCPSGTHYMHLVDYARRRIEETAERPRTEVLLRRLLAFLLPRHSWFRAALHLARLARPLAPMLSGRIGAMVSLAPRNLPASSPWYRPQIFAAAGERKKRVALLAGCVQRVIRPQIHESTVRLLTRLGCEVVVAEGSGCCGSLPHHLGLEKDTLALARANVEAWAREIADGGLDAIVVNISGCGTTVKDYGHLFRNEPGVAEAAAHVSRLARDVAEWVSELGFAAGPAGDRPVLTYQSPCSLHHGQRIREVPVDLLRAAGFPVKPTPEAHLCCGSAGTYNMLQPRFARELRDRKIASIERVGPEAIATGNIGCLVQLRSGTKIPVVHTVELLDWATGGPRPEGM